MISLYYALGSPHSAAVRIMLAEKGLEYEGHCLDLATFEQHSPKYLALNPQGMVPLLEVGGRRLSESFFILLFLDEAYPNSPLCGAGACEHYLVQKWGKYLETHIAPQLAIVRWAALGDEVPAAAGAGLEGLPAERRALWQRASDGFGADQLTTARAALVTAGERIDDDLEGRGWLAADHFTLADIAVFPHLAQFEVLGIPLPASIANWLFRVAQRASVQAIRDELFPLPVMGPEGGRWG